MLSISVVAAVTEAAHCSDPEEEQVARYHVDWRDFPPDHNKCTFVRCTDPNVNHVQRIFHLRDDNDHRLKHANQVGQTKSVKIYLSILSTAHKGLIMKTSVLIFAVAVLMSASTVQADAATNSPHVTIRSLTAPMATKLAMAAYDDCTAKGHHVAVAVVGRDGRLLAFVRSPLAGPHTIEVSQGKAYTANTFRASTTQLMGRDFMRDIPGALIWGGGLPINVGGYFYGGVGVAGAPEKETPGDVDDECAAAGIAAVTEDIEFGEM